MSKNPKVFAVGDIVEHPQFGRCEVMAYYKGARKPYDLRKEDQSDGRSFHWVPSYKKDMSLAGPRPPEVYEEWFR